MDGVTELDEGLYIFSTRNRDVRYCRTRMVVSPLSQGNISALHTWLWHQWRQVSDVAEMRALMTY